MLTISIEYHLSYAISDKMPPIVCKLYANLSIMKKKM